MVKAKLKVLRVKEDGDTWHITVDTSEEGRRVLMQAGIDVALKNFCDDNIDKLSWWERFKYAWKCSKNKNKRSIKQNNMSWNYRIIKRKCKVTGEVYYGLNEVFYKKTGELLAFSDEDDIVADRPQEIVEVLYMMLADAKKDRPILTEEDFG